MADNFAFTPGEGATGASDEISDVHYPIVKPAFGALGTATLVTSTDQLPVKIYDVNDTEVDWLSAQSITLLLENTKPTTSWTYTSGLTPIFVSSIVAVTAKTADASLRHYVDSIQITTIGLSAASIFTLHSGAGGTVLWSQQIPITAFFDTKVYFPPGAIKTSAATLLEMDTSVSSTVGMTINIQGHTAA